VLPGASPALGSTSPGRRVESCAQLPCSPGTSPALGSTSLGVRVFCPRLRRCSCLRLLPVRRHVSAAAAASARCLCAAAPPPLQLPPLAARAPPLLRRCSCLRAVFCNLCSARCVFCAALCVAIFLRCVRFPQFALCALCSVTCAVPSGSCQPGCARAKLRFFRVRSPALSLHVQAVGSRGLIT
jgi:hypothetical protein